MDRRNFMAGALAGVAGLISGCSATLSRNETTQRPNFIFILTDDQRWDAMGFIGRYPWLKTPNIDRLREEGAHFKNAFVTHSICSPSRASFLTGCYSHVHGVIQNESRDYDYESCPSFAQILQQNDYKTGFLGKWHQGHGAHPRPGFDHWAAFDGQGYYNNTVINENGQEKQTEGYITDVLNEKAVSFIDAQDGQNPFLLYLSHKAVHAPFIPAQRHAGQYSGIELPKPENFDDNFETKPQWFAKNFTKGVYRTSRPGDYNIKEVSEQEWNPEFGSHYDNRSYTEYYRTISAVDDGIGEIMSALDKKGMLDNTVIVFAGDNGFFLGEHRLLDKRLMYEESIRIPLLMRYPAAVKPGLTIDELVLNIDLAPTIVDIAGIEVPAHMQGSSWLPLLGAENRQWRKSFMYEYFVDMIPSIPTMVGVRTEKWKLIRYPDLTDIDEMYDLENDPHEMNNLSTLAKYSAQKQRLETELEGLMKQTGYYECKWNLNPVVHQPGRKGEGLVFEYGETEIAGGESVPIKDADSLVLKNGPFTVDIEVNVASDGVIAAKGGFINGLCFFVQNGIPCFAFRANESLYVADGKENCLGKRTRLTGMVFNSKAHLYINGKLVSAIPLSPFYYMAEPAEGLEIGKETGTPVVGEIIDTGFSGYMYSLKIYDRQLTAEQIMNL
jgi:arylsulfatase A-like enzyme